MSGTRDVLIAAVEKSKGTWDFDGSASELREAVAAIHADSTLLDISKRPLLNLAAAASTVLEERRRSGEHLIAAVEGVSSRVASVTPDDLKLLAGWFFHVAYSGGTVSPELEQLIRPVLRLTQGDPAANGKRFANDLERYRRLAEWGVDLALTENNLRGFLGALRVLVFEADVAEGLRNSATSALQVVAARRALAPADLLKDGIARCEAVIGKAWRNGGSTGLVYFSQDDTFALHICLNAIGTALSGAEAVAMADELMDEVDILLAQFQQMRYPSSTTLLVRARAELAALEASLDRSLDFGDLRARLKELQKRINDARRGKRGVNWMHSDHVEEALSIASTLYNKIKAKETSLPDFERELRLIDDAIVALETAPRCPAAGQLKRWMARVKKDSLLAQWAQLCCRLAEEKRQAEERLVSFRTRFNALWERMREEEGKRIEDLAARCAALRAEIRESMDPASVLAEILEVAAGREDFTRARANDIQRQLDALFSAFRDRVADVAALDRALDELEQEIARSGKRLLRFIDFDDLFRRATEARRWVGLRDFPAAKRAEATAQVNRVFGELRRLRFRQERAKAELQAKAERVVAELKEEIDEVRTQVLQRPGRQETWHALVELDARLNEYSKLLSEAQRKELKALVDGAFQAVRASRAAFAAQAAKVFAEYNEVLSDTLFALEEEPTRDVAFEAIERIKPLRSALKDERRLLRPQRQELIGLLGAISAAINEVFDKAAAQGVQEASRLRADIERLEARIAATDSWRAANELIPAHKELSSQLRDSQVSIIARKELRVELDRLWDDISERLRALRSSRDTREDVNESIERLERKGHLLIVNAVPTIA